MIPFPDWPWYRRSQTIAICNPPSDTILYVRYSGGVEGYVRAEDTGDSRPMNRTDLYTFRKAKEIVEQLKAEWYAEMYEVALEMEAQMYHSQADGAWV